MTSERYISQIKSASTGTVDIKKVHDNTQKKVFFYNLKFPHNQSNFK